MTSTVRAQSEPKAFTPEDSCLHCASCYSCPLEEKQNFLTKQSILPCKWDFKTSPPSPPLLVSMEHKGNQKKSKVNPLVINTYGPVLDYQAKVDGETQLANVSYQSMRKFLLKHGN